MAKIVGMSLDYLVKNLYDMLYPVGICIDFDTESVNPNTAFPGTTWVRISDGAYVVASGVSAGTIAGSNSFTIGVANLPAHSHTMAHTHSIAHNHGTITSSSAGAHTHTISGNTGGGGDHSHTRGTMNITASTSIDDQQMGSNFDPAGAFVVEKDGPKVNWDAHSDRTSRGYRMRFDASKTWTGSTSASGTHTHSFSATTPSTGAHTHTTAIPNYSGNSGGSSAANTGSSGAGTAISFTPTFHRYARWKRTA